MSKEGVEKAYKAARSIAVKEVMTSPAVTVTQDDTVAEAVRKMLVSAVFIECLLSETVSL
jgi:CBS domain-containing protein